MKKADLLYYDLEAPDWLVSRAKLKARELVRDKDEEAGIWLYKFYKGQDIKKGEYLPCVVIFKDKHTWLNYYPQEKKWGKASIDHMYDETLYNYTRVLRNLRRWQDKILCKRSNAEKRKEKIKTADVMRYVPELPEDFREFCEEDVMIYANYLVYSSNRKKVFCTHCKEEYDLKDLIQRNEKKPKHGEVAMCDKCLIELQTLSEGMSRRGKYFRRSTEILQPYKDGLMTRTFNLFRDFNESLTPTTHISEVWRQIYLDNKQTRYEMRWDGKGNQTWHRIKPGRYFTTVSYIEGKVYMRNVREVIQGSQYSQYGLVDYYTKHGVIMRHGFGKALLNVILHPSIEQIIKAGLYELTEEMIEGSIYRDMICEGETELVKMLKIDREQLRWLRSKKGAYEILRILQKANEKGKYISEIELDAYLQSKHSLEEQKFLLEPKINTKKACAYILEHGITIQDFKDHMDLLEKFGFPLKKKWLYPKDFHKTHQEEIEMDILKNEKVSPKLQRQYKKTYSRWEQIAKKVTMQDNDYQIIFPKDCLDIKIEGKVLHHCVGNYTQRAAQGDTVILFMRNRKDVEKRLYTMEYQDGRLIQIRAHCNGAPTPEAKALAERFAAEFAIAEKKYIEQEQKKLKKAAI